MSILIQNAKVVDGTGNPWYYSDIEIDDGRIKQVGRKLSTRTETTIDAAGLVASPGFVDPHCHSEGPFVFRPDMEQCVTQGITSQVFGMCGRSPFPDKETFVDWLSRVWGGSLNYYTKQFEESSYDWHSLTEYAKLVMSRRPAINAVPFLGLGTILWKAGFKVTTEAEVRRITNRELETVEALVGQGLVEGAVGLSTTRDYFPDRYLDIADLAEIVKVVAAHGRVFQPHTLNIARPDGISQAIEIARRTGVKLHIAHINVAPSWGYGNVNVLPECLGIVETAREEGLDVDFNVIQNMSYCYGPGTMIRNFRYWCMHCSDTPLAGVESLEQFRQNAQDPAYRRRAADMITKYVGRAQQYLGGLFAEHLDSIILVKTGDERYEGKTLGEIAKQEGTNPRDLFFDIGFEVSPIIANGPETVIIMGLTAGYPQERNIVQAANHPLGMPSSDVSVESVPADRLRFYTPAPYTTMPYYYRKATDHGVRMEDAVRKMTSFPAQVLGLRDRGIIREGMKADIVIFDPVEFRSAADYYCRGSLADYYDPRRKAVGISHVIVNGKVVLDHGVQTEARPGEVLLHQVQ